MTLPTHYLGRDFPIIQQQPSIDVSIKRCSDNMQQIYLKKAMPECDFNKVAKQLLKSHFSMSVLFLRTLLEGSFSIIIGEDNNFK